MSLNLYGNIGTTYTGIVTGAELRSVTEEIFGGANLNINEKIAKQPQEINSQPKTLEQYPSDKLNLYSRNTDINTIQQIAQTKVDFNVQLSPQALQNIQALKTMAATQQTNVHKLSEGKVQLPVENTPKTEAENIFALTHPSSIVKMDSLGKDKNGSGSLGYSNLPSEKKEESTQNKDANVNIIA